MDLEKLNSLIDNFPYSEEDLKDRPVRIKSMEKKKLAGGAWQLWQMLRLFPLIIQGHIKDPNNEVWKLVLKLKEVGEMVVAPEMHTSFLGDYQEAINDYLTKRKELFPLKKFRNKHHYLLHQPEQTLFHGPAIKTWTLRFESKHPFFCRSWRSSNNSINFLQTLSCKHEFLQSWVRSGGGVRCEIEASGRSPFVHAMYSAAITKSLTKCAPVLDECSHVTLHGTKYKKSHVLILKRDTYCEKPDVGVIHLILLDSHDSVNFVVRSGTAVLSNVLNAYNLTLTNNFQCVNPTDLLSFYPHSTYVRGTQTYICLRHALVGKPI